MDRRKFLVGLGSLAAGAAAASGTGAFTAARLDRSADINVTNDANAYISLVPGDARGASERVEVDNGELQIDFDANGANGGGVNDDARYQIGAMDDDASGTNPEFESLFDDDTNPSALGNGTPYVPADQGTVDGGDADGSDPTNPTNVPQADDRDQSAFVVRNHSGQRLDIQIGYRLDESNQDSNTDNDGAVLYLQGHASAIAESSAPNDDNTRTDDAVATGALDFDETTGQPDNEQVLSFQDGNVSGDEGIPPGEAIYVSLQVDTTGGEGEPDLSGSLVVSANEAAEPTSGG